MTFNKQQCSHKNSRYPDSLENSENWQSRFVSKLTHSQMELSRVCPHPTRQMPQSPHALLYYNTGPVSAAICLLTCVVAFSFLCFWWDEFELRDCVCKADAIL
jgi:hypothetical protein